VYIFPIGKTKGVAMSSNFKIESAQDIGVAVRRRRKESGLTLAETAGLTNVGVRFLSELENGKPTVRLDKLMHVLEALGLHLQLIRQGDPSE